jgi:hypothetical protein
VALVLGVEGVQLVIEVTQVIQTRFVVVYWNDVHS